jgi:hypothetical protein
MYVCGFQHLSDRHFHDPPRPSAEIDTAIPMMLWECKPVYLNFISGLSMPTTCKSISMPVVPSDPEQKTARVLLAQNRSQIVSRTNGQHI